MTTTEYLATTFGGVHFGRERPYSPPRAKHLLDLAMKEIRQSDELREIGVDPTLSGRDRIKEEEEGVWDFVRLVGSNGNRAFNELPHFTLALRPGEVLAVLILPNRWLAGAGTQKVLKDRGFDSFRAAIAGATEKLASAVGSSPSARPWILVQQRRAPKGQQLTVRDARIEFDPQTAVGLKAQTTDQNELKPQPQWLKATYSALVDKSSNLEMCIGARFLYSDQIVQSPDLTKRVIESWGACRPLLDAVLPRLE